MKKWMLILIVAGPLAIPAQNANVAPRKIIETVGTTNYVGEALATRTGGSPSTNAAVWRIKKLVVSGDIVDVTHAFNTNAVGDQTTQNIWTNRVNATYY